MQLILVSGLSGAGKSIALNVLEDGGYYCVDNLPANLLLEVMDFLADAGHDRVAVSIDARSAALPELPQHLARLAKRGVDCRVLYLEASAQALLRRFSETRRRHPLASAGLTLSEAIERERTLLAGVAALGQRVDTSDLQPRVLQNWIPDLLGVGPESLTLLFESFAYRDGLPLDANWVLDARMLRPARPVAAGDRAREPQLRERRDRLHRRAPPLGVPRRAARRILSCRMAGLGASPRAGKGRFSIENLPLFPLNTVLFPGGRLPLRIFEQRYMEMAKACLRDGAPFGVCLIRNGAEVGAPATPVDIGCLAHIAEWDMEQLGVLQVIARGGRRFRVLERRVQADGLLRASIEILPEDEDSEIPQSCGICVRLLERVIDQQRALLEPPYRLESSAWVSSRLAEILPLPLAVKQLLLETADGRSRLEKLNGFLTKEPARGEA